MVSLGYISSFTEATLKERRIPTLIQAILLLTLVRFNQNLIEFSQLYYYFLGGFISSVIVFLCILGRFKASLHMIGISALTAFIYGLILFYNLPYINSIAFSIICIGLVASSRLYMKSHSPFELFVGLLIGIIPQISLWHFWL
uniref:hypothetical protein n=1 Tax=Flavobacterium sp. TaxID=239 RepID=UPI00404B51A2